LAIALEAAFHGSSYSRRCVCLGREPQTNSKAGRFTDRQAIRHFPVPNWEYASNLSGSNLNCNSLGCYLFFPAIDASISGDLWRD
jgi:hypothetical protein